MSYSIDGAGLGWQGSPTLTKYVFMLDWLLYLYRSLRRLSPQGVSFSPV